MKKINFKKLETKLKGKLVERPNKANAGTLSGHAAGEPFEKLVYHELKQEYGADKIFKQYEFLNDLYLKNPAHIKLKQKKNLFDSPVTLYLLTRSDKATRSWRPNNIFEEKQDDTADILYHDKNFFNIVDVKTKNIDKDSRAPNIISSYKLACACALMIDNDDFDNLDINYLEVEWKEEGEYLRCINAYHCDLFKVTPQNLYINWAAGLQIQFFVNRIDQSWEGTRKEWAIAYLKKFVVSAEERCKKMRETYIEPFLKYLEIE